MTMATSSPINVNTVFLQFSKVFIVGNFRCEIFKKGLYPCSRNNMNTKYTANKCILIK